DRGSWLVYTLPYLEQDSLFKRIPSGITSINQPIPAGVPDMNGYFYAGGNDALRKPLPYIRCPSDDWDASAHCTNYVGSMGPKCVTGPCGYNPYQGFCDGNAAFSPPAGYGWSPDHGNTVNARELRGMFNRLGAAVNMASVKDGLSNTIMVGENLPAHFDHLQGGNWWHFNAGVAHCSTVVPINTRSDGNPSPDGCRQAAWNWNESMGFKSNHTNGANFVFGDGSVRFVTQTIDHRTYQLLGCRNDGQPVNLP
ncbi:MAG: DUF1559 domain-containing protein, partial [Gemmataceae bacterium]